MRLWTLLSTLILAGACGNPAASRPMVAAGEAPSPVAAGGAAAPSPTVSGSFTAPDAREEVALRVEAGEGERKRAVLVLRGAGGGEIARVVADEEPAGTSFEPSWSLLGPVPLGETGRSGAVLLRRSVTPEASGLAAELSELTVYAARGRELEPVHSENADRIRVEIDGALLRVTLIEHLGGGSQGEQVAEDQVTLAWRDQGFAETP